MSDQTTIETQIAEAPIIVYSKSYCPFCTQTKNLLQGGGVNYQVIELDNISNGKAIQDTLKVISGQNTVPNIFIGGKHLGGNSDLQSARGNGSLKTKLDEANVANTF